MSNIAYLAHYPMISGSSTFPGLSDGSKYPNFWRTILPDTVIPAAWLEMAKMFGFSRVTPVIGDTGVWQSVGQMVVHAAQEKGIQLDGHDLAEEVMASGLSGYQI